MKYRKNKEYFRSYQQSDNRSNETNLFLLETLIIDY